MNNYNGFDKKRPKYTKSCRKIGQKIKILIKKINIYKNYRISRLKFNFNLIKCRIVSTT
jgi:hypothetical protein